MRILLIEDQRQIADFIIKGLRAERFAVDWADTAEKGTGWVNINAYDLGIFDVRLPNMSGIEACKLIRSKGETFPVIILSVMQDAFTKVDALNGGADDYLQKPFFLAELIARVRALLRRGTKVENPVIKFADLLVDTIHHTALRAGQPIPLNRKEFGLLEYFVRNPRVTLTREMILEHVWDANVDPFTNTVDVHVRYLREKIDGNYPEKLIKTVHGYGYKLETESDEPVKQWGSGKRK